MYEFINKDRIDISTGGKIKNELEWLIQDIGLGYTELLLDNLKQLGDHGFKDAESLFNKLMELRNKKCELRLDIESPQQLDKEIGLVYWLNFKFLYGYTSIVNYIVYNGEIKVTDEDEALNTLYNYYKTNPQDVADKLSWLAKNENVLYEISKTVRRRIIDNMKCNKCNKVSNDTDVSSNGTKEFKLSDLNSVLIF